MENLTRLQESIRAELDSAVRPLFFFDDDPDGLCSFLLLYNRNKNGKGIVIKSSPDLGVSYFEKVEEYAPDKIFILDKPQVSQEFLDLAHKNNIKVFWIDHHPPQERQFVVYFNPRIVDSMDNRPTSYWAYQISQGNLWMAMTGCVADWHLPVDLHGPFSEKYPDLLDSSLRLPQDALFGSRLGFLCRIFSFCLKGASAAVRRNINILTRIEDPYEILEGKTSRSKVILRHFEHFSSQYQTILAKIKPKDERLIVFTYADSKTSFTSDLSNELLYKYPDKVIFLARQKGLELKCSIRSSELVLPPIIQKALDGVEGYGGGHDNACGACIKKKDFKRFVTQFKEQINASYALQVDQ